MLIYDRDEDVLTMEDFDDETMKQETTKGDNYDVDTMETSVKGDKSAVCIL